MTRRIFQVIITIVAVAAVSVSAGCVQDQETNSGTEQVFKIGAVIPLTGAAADFGGYNRESTKLVIDELQDSLSLKVKTYIEDSKSSPKDAASAYRSLMARESGFEVISSELSSVSMSLAPLTAQNKQALLAIAAAPKLNQHRYTLRAYPTAAAEAEAFADAAERFASSTDPPIAVFHINDDFGSSVSKLTLDELSERGFKSVSSESFTADTPIRSLVAKHRDASVYVVVGYGSTMGTIIRRIQTVNQEATIVASPEVMFESVLSTISLPDKDLYYLSISSPSEEMIQLYKTQLNRRPNQVDILVFDGFNIILRAAKVLNEEGRDISGNALYSYITGRSFEFYGRSVAVDEQGNFQYELVLEQVQ